MKIKSLFIIFILFFITACSDKKETGAVDIRWDRETCERCVMAVSDHNYSAQVRHGKKVYKFDDIGCAVIWLDKQDWKTASNVEIWVNDYRNEKWIDAQKSWFVKGKTTPMDYGLGAQTEKIAGALDFTQAKKHIYEVEKTLKRHKKQGGHSHK